MSDPNVADDDEIEEEEEDTTVQDLNDIKLWRAKITLLEMLQDRGYKLPPEEAEFLDMELEDLVSSGEEVTFDGTYRRPKESSVLKTVFIRKEGVKQINKQDAINALSVLKQKKEDEPKGKGKKTETAPVVNALIVISNNGIHHHGADQFVWAITENNIKFQFFKLDRLLVNPTRHIYASTYTPLTNEDRIALAQEGVSDATLPLIKYANLVDVFNEKAERKKDVFIDPIVEHYGWEPPQVVREEAELFALPFLNPDYLSFSRVRR